MQQELTTVTIDLAKKVLHLVGVDTTGAMLWRKRLTRHALMSFLAQLTRCASASKRVEGTHYWTRRFREHGHEGKRIAPQFVTPFVKSNKNDMRDAEAIAEAVTRPTMRFVPAKDIDQPDIQALHRVRERLIGERTALVNAVHGLMYEYGIVLPKGVAKFRQAVVAQLASAQDTLTVLGQLTKLPPHMQTASAGIPVGKSVECNKLGVFVLLPLANCTRILPHIFRGYVTAALRPS